MQHSALICTTQYDNNKLKETERHSILFRNVVIHKNPQKVVTVSRYKYAHCIHTLPVKSFPISTLNDLQQTTRIHSLHDCK